MKDNEVIEVIVCMGSSCFARGNKKNLEYIESLIQNNDLNIKLDLSGNRCAKKCAEGPNIIINNKMYNNVTKEDIEKLLLGFSPPK